MAMNLSNKLRIQPGQRLLFLNAPPGYVELLGPMPADVEVCDSPQQGTFDFVHLFVKTVDELARLGPVAIQAAKYDGLLWISYPKRSSGVDTDLTRDRGWETLSQAGLRPVTQVSIDEVWSALRFRPIESVKTRT